MKIVILNTECSNLLSVKTSLAQLGYFAEITSDKNKILSANKIIFPGIGSAFSIMKKLKKLNLIEVIKSITQPMLGICLGMQVLSSFSEESKGTDMLGILKLDVSLIRTYGLPLPHIGWNNIKHDKNNLLFKDINDTERFYFVHSYVLPVSKYTISTSFYGQTFSSAIQKKNFFGVQFHPEKSSFSGRKLLKNFLEM